MCLTEQAQKYLAAIPPAVAGQQGHSQTLTAARALVYGFNLPLSVALPLLQDWNRTCQPPWDAHDLERKLDQANTLPFDKPRGWLLTGRKDRQGKVTYAPPPARAPVADAIPPATYNLDGATIADLPVGLPDAFPQLLRACFAEGEGVRIMGGFTEAGDIGCDPHGGIVLPREDWLNRMAGGKTINWYYNQASGSRPGVYLGVNPMQEAGKMRDTDVTSFRHVLLEFDKISVPEQWALYQQSNLPLAAVIYSGNKSLHAWVKIHAKDLAEYKERVAIVYEHFKAYLPDPHNKNPSRLSRCPDAIRGQNIQSLHALDIGAPNFAAWAKDLLVEGIGHSFTFKEIFDYKPQEDGKTLAGNLWLRKGGSVTLVGGSGLGKSSLAAQFLMAWAIGRPMFGIQPARPLKTLTIQAENDAADLHGIVRGLCQGLTLDQDPEALALLNQNFIVNHNNNHTGPQFLIAMQRLIERHEPDLVCIDPILSFIGDDISKQSVCSEFLRNQLNPIAEATGVGWFCVHHTGKIYREQPKGKTTPPPRTMSEMAYLGMGSSELTNWSRAIMVLNELPAQAFELVLAKRGKRAEATHPNGNLTTTIRLRQNPAYIHWDQLDFTEECAGEETGYPPPHAPKATRLGKPEQFAGANLTAFLAACPPAGERYLDLVQRINLHAAKELGLEANNATWRRALELCLANHKLEKFAAPVEAGDKSFYLYRKGPNA